MQQHIIYLVCATVLTFNALNVAGDCYTYKDSEADIWKDTCEECGKFEQSPVDLRRISAIPRRPTPAMQFQNFQRSYSNGLVFNDGHAISVRLREDEPNPPTISGGFLPRPYQFFQSTFRWPSQHTIDGKRYPFEMHITFVQTAYGRNALNFSDGLVTLAILYDRSPIPNQNLQLVVSSLNRVRDANSNTTVPALLPLAVYLPKNSMNYFTYHGSLVTPPCSEASNWAVFTTPMYGTQRQFDAFTQLLDIDGKNITSNNRPTQPLNNRAVLMT